jgi:parvulin-like peptidyl-prolyl isomerase
VPEQIQQQFRSEQGKQAFAEQIIRLKIVEQEGRKLGLERDPKVAGQISADRTNVLAQATMPKLVPPPTDADVQKFYNEHKAQFSTVDLSHILIAYQGGAIPPRNGRALTQEQAAAKAAELYRQIQSGADFAQVARQNSDDVQSAANGGKLGPYSPGRLPQEIDAQVSRLRPGQVSGPILSQFGIHLFKVGSATPVPLAQIKPQLTAQLQRENAFKRVEELRKTAKVDFDPKFFPEGDRVDTSGAVTPGMAGPAVGPNGAAPLGTRPAAKPPQSRP